MPEKKRLSALRKTRGGVNHLPRKRVSSFEKKLTISARASTERAPRSRLLRSVSQRPGAPALSCRPQSGKCIGRNP